MYMETLGERYTYLKGREYIFKISINNNGDIVYKSQEGKVYVNKQLF